MQRVNEIKEPFWYLYNPPPQTTISVATEGSLARQEFAEDYGGFVELIYLICTRLGYKIEEVDNWKTDKFLSLGQYLYRKNNIENMK